MKSLAYPSYKPSGVEWLGDIPSHWQPKRMRFLLTQKLQYGANEAAELDDPELPRYVRITDIDEQGTLREETFRSLPVEIAKPYLLKDGDILFARSGATSGKTFLYRNSWGTCAYAGYLIRARLNQGKMLPSFLRYFTASANYWQWLSSSTIQATIQNVSAEKYADLWLTYPPLEEQQAIADFLDAQTVKIDTLLAKKRQFIAKLKEKRSALIARTVTRGLPPAAAHAAGLEPHPAMKDSSVVWVGNIPVHWNVRPIRYLFKNLDSKRIPLSGEDRATLEKLYPYYGASGIIDQVDEYIFDEPLILVAEDGANLLSRSSPLAFLATGKYWVNNHAHILRPIIGDISYWVSVLQTFDFTPLVTGAAQPKLTADRLGGIRLPVPPVHEQQAIAAYLDRETARIDQLTAKVESVIARLTEYRQALITAAVTGKIAVRARTVG